METTEVRENIDRRTIEASIHTVLPVVKRNSWLVAAKKLSAYADQNPFMSEFVIERHGITLGVARLLRAWGRTHRAPKMPETNEEVIGAEFIVSLAKAIRELGPQGRNRLRGMIQGAIDSDMGLGPVGHELTVAAELERRGWKVKFEDLEGAARFDLLATRAQETIEIECKSISGDIGRRIHQRDFLRLVHRLNPILKDLGQREGLHIVEFDLSDRLNKDNSSHEDIARTVRKALEDGEIHTERSGSAKYFYESVDSHLLSLAASSVANLRRYVEKTYLGSVDKLNRMTAAWASKRKSCVVFTMKSKQPDKVVDGIYRQLKDKAASQFTKTRPALLCIRLEAITRDQLLDLASKASNTPDTAPVFQKMVNALMTKRPWVHTIAFVPQSRSSPTKQGGYTTESSVYVFHNPSNLRAEDPLLAVFG